MLKKKPEFNEKFATVSLKSLRGHGIKSAVRPRSETQSNGVLVEKVDELGVRLAIGDDFIEQGQWPDAGWLGLGKFAVVGDQDFLLRLVQRFVFHRQLVKVEAGCAVLQSDACR